jgi:hypothetical protein
MTKKETIERKLDYLCERLAELEDFNSDSIQARYLADEIDYYRTELLKIETQEYFRGIEDEDH